MYGYVDTPAKLFPLKALFCPLPLRLILACYTRVILVLYRGHFSMITGEFVAGITCYAVLYNMLCLHNVMEYILVFIAKASVITI